MQPFNKKPRHGSGAESLTARLSTVNRSPSSQGFAISARPIFQIRRHFDQRFNIKNQSRSVIKAYVDVVVIGRDVQRSFSNDLARCFGEFDNALVFPFSARAVRLDSSQVCLHEGEFGQGLRRVIARRLPDQVIAGTLPISEAKSKLGHYLPANLIDLRVKTAVFSSYTGKEGDPKK